MNSYPIYGLGTDNYINGYCRKRKIPYSDVVKQVRTLGNEYDSGHMLIKDLCSIVDYAFEKLDVNDKRKKIFLIGHGMYHHYSYGILKRAKRTKKETLLINIDEHDDFISAESGRIHCGSHAIQSMKERLIERYAHIHDEFGEPVIHTYLPRNTNGRTIELIEPEISYYDLTDQNYVSDRLKKSIAASKLEEMYLTIDIDVLSKKYVKINSRWGSHAQGEMTLPTLLTLVDALMGFKRKIIGIDICGMTKDKRSGYIYDSLLEVIN